MSSCAKCGSAEQRPSGGCLSCYRRKANLDEAQVLEFLAQDTTRGNLARAARHFGVHRASITKLLKRPAERLKRQQKREAKRLAKAAAIAEQKRARELERAQRRATAAERKRETTRLWRLRSLDEQRKLHRERARQWRLDNPEEFKEKARRFRDANRRRIAARARELYRNDPENRAKRLASVHRRRAKQFGAEFEWHPLVAHFYHRAHKLNTAGENVHVDHIVPLASGGPHTIHNLRIVPADENMAKGAKVPSIDDLETIIADHVTDPNYGVYWWIQAENAKSAAG